MKFDLSKKHCYYFNELSKIPRASRNEKAASAWIQQFAEEHQLECWKDEWGNIIVNKSGSKGHEKEPWLMLQAHLDMVPATMEGHSHDWDNDPLDLYVEGDYLRARGTTLGADDGAGVAMMLAILDNPNLIHPPLECVFTVMEEIGLEGALHLKPEHIRSRRVISLDGGGETATMCCAAGGIKEFAHIQIQKEAYEGNTYLLSLYGLLGGHSGIAIAENHANGILLMLRWLHQLDKQGTEYRLVSLNGGQGDNSIANNAKVVLKTSASQEELNRLLSTFEKEIKEEYWESDPGIAFQVEALKNVDLALSLTSQQDLLSFLELVPNGVFATSKSMENLPTTSNNIGCVETMETEIVAMYRIRSLFESGLDDVLHHMETASKGKNIRLETIIRYPGWPIAKASPLRDSFQAVVQRKYGRDIVVEGTHGGNETGIWYGLHPDSDIISIGSIEEFIHTPQERMNLEAFDRMMDLLNDLLEEVCQ